MASPSQATAASLAATVVGVFREAEGSGVAASGEDQSRTGTTTITTAGHSSCSRTSTIPTTATTRTILATPTTRTATRIHLITPSVLLVRRPQSRGPTGPSAEDIATNVNAKSIVRPRDTVAKADETIARQLVQRRGRWFHLAGPRILRDRRTREPVCCSEPYMPNTPKGRRAIAVTAMSPDDIAHQVIEQEIRADLLDKEQAAPH